MPVDFENNHPTNLDEAVAALEKGVTADEEAFLKSEPVNEILGRLHHGFGTAMRNNWGLWKPDSALGKFFRETYGLGHADDISGVIMTAFLSKLQGVEHDVAAQVERYKEHWRKMGVNLRRQHSPTSGCGRTAHGGWRMTPKPTLMLDLEVYRDYFLAGLLNAETGNVRQFDTHGETGRLSAEDIDTIKRVLEAYRIVTFNGSSYDMPILAAALSGADCLALKEISDKIVKLNLKPWNLGIEPPPADHIDLIEVAPGQASLKIYGGRLHCRKMQDLPIHEAASIAPEQRELLRTYNGNDLFTTRDLWNHLQPQLDLREQMSKVYGIDLRSKSDAQIAEAVIAKEVGKALGEAVRRPEVAGGTRFKYVAPAFVRFETDPLRELLAQVHAVEFLVTDGGTVQMPDELKKAVIRIGGSAYKIGIGGLHSQEKTVSYYADAEYGLCDKDAASYYPAIIINNDISPPHTNGMFMKVYSGKRDERITAKRVNNKTAADTLKIFLNGIGGKLNSKWSKFYFPQGFIHMTLTGQLSMLMLIERLESAGIAVVSANTDGIAIYYPVALAAEMDRIVAEWEALTHFDIETTEYASLHKHSVNSYVALKTNGKFTLKGEYVHEELCPSKDGGIATNPANLICVEAVCKFLRDDTPIEQTIRNCTDIRKFITIRQVNGGAVDQSGAYLGKAVRWYYAKGVEGPLRYSINNYTVARSEGARACMELPDALPEDLDSDWYILEARSILADLGVDAGAYAVRGLV